MKILLSLLITILYVIACRNASTTPKGKGNLTTDSNAYTSDCQFEDGTHAATVDYYNPHTDYRAIYELDVHVAGCKITRIDFPKGGWLDEDHIYPTEIDSNGDATLADDNGSTWQVHLR